MDCQPSSKPVDYLKFRLCSYGYRIRYMRQGTTFGGGCSLVILPRPQVELWLMIRTLGTEEHDVLTRECIR